MNTLIDRLSKLEGPDREVDAEIALQNGWQVFPGDNWIGPEAKIVVPDYTASVDAAIALAEKVLPGWYWGITQGDDGEDAMEFQGNIWPSIQPYPAELEQYGYHKFPAIALLIAILRAKEAEHGE